MTCCCSIQSLKTRGLKLRPVTFKTGTRSETFETEARKNKSRDSSRDRDQPLLLDRALQGYAVLGFRDAQDEYLFVCPLPSSSLEKCKKYRHSETSSDVCYVQKDDTTKLHHN